MNILYAFISKEAISQRLDALVDCLGLPACLMDAQGTLLESHGESAAYCTLLKEKACCGEQCTKTHVKAGKIAYALGESYIFSCHAELNHIAFSLVNRRQLLGTIIIGPFLMDAPDSTLLSSLADQHCLAPSVCLDLYDELQKLPVIPPVRVHSISRLMEFLFAPLLSDERLLMQEKQAKLYQQSKISESIQLYKGSPRASTAALIYQKEQELLSKVRQCDIHAAKAVLNELLGIVLLAEGQNLPLIRERAMELTVLLSRIAIEGGATAESVLALNPRYLEQLQSAQTQDELCFSLQEIVENFIQSISLPAPGKVHPVVRKAVAYIADHFDQPLSMQSLADLLQVSPTYFSAIFSRSMGIGFHEYLTRFRVEEAKHLLTATRYPINQIAVTVGYADQSSFTKAFRRITGLTPCQCRG